MIRGGPRSARDELAMLQSRLVEMAAVVEEALRGATEALARRDTAAARAVIDGDRQVDAIELEIDEASIQLLALHQPVAGDLRLITTTMRIASDLERIGDHAVNIAEAAIRLADHQSAPEYRELVEMARLARGMVAEALDAFTREDPRTARAVLLRDSEVDALQASLFRVVLAHMMEESRRITPGITLLLAGRNYERVADLATNIAEDAVYFVEGRAIKHGGGLPAPAAPDTVPE